MAATWWSLTGDLKNPYEIVFNFEWSIKDHWDDLDSKTVIDYFKMQIWDLFEYKDGILRDAWLAIDDIEVDKDEHLSSAHGRGRIEGVFDVSLRSKRTPEQQFLNLLRDTYDPCSGKLTITPVTDVA